MKFKYGLLKSPKDLYYLTVSCVIGALLILFMSRSQADLFSHKSVILLLVAPIFVILSVINIIWASKAKKHPEIIELKSDGITFSVNKQMKVIAYDEIKNLFQVCIDNSKTTNNRQASIITQSREKFNFEEAKFESKADYEKFYAC